MTDITEYPYHGAFFEITVDMDADLDKREPITTLVFETECDIQRSAKLHTGTLNAADYTVYFPLKKNPDATGTVDKYGPVKLRRGMRFKGEAYGYTYEGEVEIIRMSQLGACSCDIKVLKESKR